MYILKGVCASMQALFCCCLENTSCIFMHVVFIKKTVFGVKEMNLFLIKGDKTSGSFLCFSWIHLHDTFLVLFLCLVSLIHPEIQTSSPPSMLI